MALTRFVPLEGFIVVRYHGPDSDHGRHDSLNDSRVVQVVKMQSSRMSWYLSSAQSHVVSVVVMHDIKLPRSICCSQLTYLGYQSIRHTEEDLVVPNLHLLL